jgi:hypothetical protein
MEGFAALHDYLEHFDGDTPESLNILIAEFIRHLLYKGSFYYPPNLPPEVMAEKPKSGELNPKLWIPLEDIYDGWEKAGQVGQEVYGAGLPFAMIPRHYWKVPNEKFMIYVGYPTEDFFAQEQGKVSIRVLGDRRLSCRLRVIPRGRASLPNLKVSTERDGSAETLQGQETPEGHMEYEVLGDRTVIVEWEARRDGNHNGSKSKNGRKGSKK